jgi:hypothetical protein
MDRRMVQIEESVARYLQQLDTADRQEPSAALKTKTSRLKEKIAKLKEQMQRLNASTEGVFTRPRPKADSRASAKAAHGTSRGRLELKGMISASVFVNAASPNRFGGFVLRWASREPRRRLPIQALRGEWLVL